MKEMERSFILKGDICHSCDAGHFETREGGYLVCVEGVSQGVFPVLPEAYVGLPLVDCSGCLIVPGLTDLHVHAPQFAFRGLGMDLELLEWLNTRTFPEEAKYADTAYAKRAYEMFVDDVRRGPNTRAVVFATCHTAATEVLMDLFEGAGLVTMVGRVNMDRNAPPELAEPSAAESAAQTLRWLDDIAGRYRNTSPILTPRFIPSCSDELMTRIAAIQAERRLPVQSHLSENLGEIRWVAELCPEASGYGDAYRRFGLFGGPGTPTVMAHCVHSDEQEIRLMKEGGVTVAHCPQSNTNLSSGIAPVRRFLDAGLSVGLGSDVAGGSDTSIFRVMRSAIEVSKLRWRLLNQDERPLSLEEAFCLGTAGGGAFFGAVGRFAPGYEFDALVIDDASLAAPSPLSIPERVARVVYYADDRHIRAKYVRGRRL